MTTNTETAIQIDPERLHRIEGESFHLRSGKGAGINGEVDACIMQAVDWLAGGTGETDAPECASQTIASLCIYLNDSPLFADYRDILKPFAPRIVGTRDSNETARLFICADYALRVFLPFWLRQYPGYNREAIADHCERAAEVTDKEAIFELRDWISSQKADDPNVGVGVVFGGGFVGFVGVGGGVSFGFGGVFDSGGFSFGFGGFGVGFGGFGVGFGDGGGKKKAIAEHGDFLRANCLECLDRTIECGK
jgi:hypothetical protein